MVYIEGMAETGVLITVENATIEPAYLDVFVFSGIDVSLDQLQPLSADSEAVVTITLAQEFEYINAIVNLVPIVVFRDGTRTDLALNNGGGMLEVDFPGSQLLSDTSNLQYMVVERLESIVIEVSWVLPTDCALSNLTQRVYINTSSIQPDEIVLIADSVSIASANDAASLLDIPDRIQLNAFLNFSSSEPIDVSFNIFILFRVDNTLLELINGSEIVAKDNVSGVALISVEYDDGSWYGNSTISIEVICAVELEIFATPYPTFSGSEQISMTSLSRIGYYPGIYQTSLIQVTLLLSNTVTRNVSELDTLSISIIQTDSGSSSNCTSIKNSILTVDKECSTQNFTLRACFGNVYSQLEIAIRDEMLSLLSY